MDQAPKILLVIPAYEAEPSVGAVAAQAGEFGFPVCVVDDGSTDRTGDMARAAGAHVLRHEQNQGKGAALKTGFAYALEQGFDAVITLDADAQHLPTEIPKFVEAWRKTKADLIIGDRSHLFGQMLRRRRMANRFSAAAISWCARTRVNDSQSGFRLYSAELVRNVPMRANGFAAESEIIVRAGLSGRKIVSIPIDLGFVNGITTSHYLPVKDTLRIAGVVIRTRFFG